MKNKEDKTNITKQHKFKFKFKFVLFCIALLLNFNTVNADMAVLTEPTISTASKAQNEISKTKLIEESTTSDSLSITDKETEIPKELKIYEDKKLQDKSSISFKTILFRTLKWLLIAIGIIYLLSFIAYIFKKATQTNNQKFIDETAFEEDKEVPIAEPTPNFLPDEPKSISEAVGLFVKLKYFK